MRRPHLVAAGALVALALAAPAARAADCPEQPLDRTFLPWLDPAWYHPAPDGGFEAGGSWRLAGGASVVEGNQPHSEGSSSLSLPGGASATTAPICVSIAHPTIRLFARNTGSPLAPLKVTVSFRTVLGLELELPMGAAVGGEQWTPTLPLPVGANLISNEVRFRFESGRGGAWQIDDVFVDPYSKG